MEYARTWTGFPARRSRTVNRLIICAISKRFVARFMWNNSIYIIGCNCRLGRVIGVFNKCSGRVIGVFNKCSGLRPSDTLSSWWLGCHRHARTGKKLVVISYDLSFQSITVILTYICLYWINGIFCGYAIPSGRHPSRIQRPGLTCGQRGGRSLPSGSVCLTVSRNKVFI